MFDTLVAPTGAKRATAGKYLTIGLHKESYGLEVLRIREIICSVDVTATPQLPDYVRTVTQARTPSKGDKVRWPLN
jgi:chemotaxis signal transduction protein